MAWTVPSGCYYGIRKWYGGYEYYNAGSSVPTGRDPSTILSSVDYYPFFILVDFTNGYIYGNGMYFKINIGASNTFTLERTKENDATWSNQFVSLFASDYSLTLNNLTLAGNTFTFGNGSGIREKFWGGTHIYQMSYSFYNRTDITSAVLPSSSQRLENTFRGCTNLQSVSGTVTSVISAYRCFHNCSSLTTPPTFQGVDPSTSTPGGNLGSFAYTYYGCSSLTTPPIFPANTKNMSFCFQNCISLTTPPTIPNTVTTLYDCFRGCTALTQAPEIPNSVTNMNGTFHGCTSLTTAPTIPSSVTYALSECFSECTSLAGAVTINATPELYNNVFFRVTNEIVLLGTGAINEIASQRENVYVWSLSQTMTAGRSTSLTTTVDVSVDVSRFNTGTLSSLSLYRDSSTTPLSVTWNDPTLTIDNIPETFTTTLTNISESDTFTLSVVATDIYGSATTTSVKIPISFYTMDVQAGGKEIAFGGLANDDVSDYPEGLFECNMSFKLKDNLFWVGTRSEYEQAVADDKMPEHTIVFITDETADYVVEEGTSGIWTYRKWNSGVSECWCITSPTSMAVSAWAAWGSVYEAKITDAIDYPTNLFTSFPTVMASATPRSTAGVMGIETSATGSASHTPYFYALRPNKPSATMSVSASIHAIGTWK